MDQALLERFDKVMANLKPVEPSVHFDFEFRKKLEAAIAVKYQETAWERIARRIAENLRYLFLPRVPALARAFVSFAAIITTGIYIYAIQPASPIAIEKEGIVLAKGPKDSVWSEVGPNHKFKAGDMITTREGSHVDIAVSKRYTARIKENSVVRIAKLTTQYGEGNALFELTGGKMLVDIEKGFKPSSFSVSTQAAIAQAIGTKFSVDVSREYKDRMDVEVLEGRVEVKSHYKPQDILSEKRMVLVGPGEKTEVASGGVPIQPQRLIGEEWRDLEELYQIGKKPRVMLLIKNTPDRVRQLLRPCPIYISDDKPRHISRLLEATLGEIENTLKTGDLSGHVKSIKMLECIVNERPDATYNAQLLAYIAAYYEYIGYHKEAVSIFTKVVRNYPESTFASISQCAIGVIYGEKLNDPARAAEAYSILLKRYPNSLEAIWLEKEENKKS